MNAPIDLSIVVPAHDERDHLQDLLEELRRALDPMRRRYEILVVDDGSTDGSGELLRAAAIADPGRLRPVFLSPRAGQSAALAAGFARARGAVIVTLDADLQNDPADLPRLLAALEHADVVSGVRVARSDPWTRRAASSIANAVRRAALGDSITDIGCSLKAYRREALAGLPMFDGVHRFLPALCAFRGARVVEVPVSHRPRRHGRSRYGVADRLGRALHDLIGVSWLKTRLLRTPAPGQLPADIAEPAPRIAQHETTPHPHGNGATRSRNLVHARRDAEA